VTTAATAEQARETVLARLVASACAFGLFAAFYAVDQRGLLLWSGRFNTDSHEVTFGALALVAALLPWVTPRWRSCVLLASSLLFGARMLHELIVVPALLAWLATRVARTDWQNWRKLTLLLGFWVAVPVVSWILPSTNRLRYGELWLYWTCLPAPLICLVIERGRGQLNHATRLDEWLYLLALPRFFMPFLQPIGAARFIDSWHKKRALRLAPRGLLLGLYGMLGFFVIQYTHYAIKNPSDAFPIAQDPWLIAQNGLRIYAFNATTIFCAVAQLRLLGYDLGSGFRFPFLSSSVSEFYRRWNYYFFEFSTSIFYLPISAKLRRWLPTRLAYVLAGYPSVLLGVWSLDKIFYQIPLGRWGAALWVQVRDWNSLAPYVFMWTLIIVPQALLTPLRRWRGFTWWRVVSHVTLLSLVVGLLTLFFYFGVTIY
jgi:hypothetical protein